MIVALSTDAAPRASLDELVDGCRRRGLSALHVVAGHAHGLPERSTDAELVELHAQLGAADVKLASYEVRCAETAALDTALRICAPFQATLVLPHDVPELLAQWQPACERAGVVIVHALDINAADGNVAAAAAARLLGGAPQHITLRGGGPEAAQHEGRGVGTLMAQLALRGYQGVLALAPSHTAVLPVWRAWLQHGKHWGCGSKRADAALVQLG